MPNRPTHLAAAVALGTLTAAYKALELSGLQYAAELAGGALGGAVGGLGPDWVDPPTSPFHRGVGHSAVSCVLTGLASRRIDAWLAGWGSHLALDFGSVRSLPAI